MSGFASSVRPGRMSLAVALLAVVCGFGVSCGPSTSQPQVATTSSSGGASPGGAPSGDGSVGGATGGSSAGDGGSSSGAGSPTSNSTSSPPPDVVGTSPPGGTPSVPPPDPCAGLVPASVGLPVEVVVATQGSCGPSTSDPSGHVLLGLWNGSSWQMTPYSAAGSLIGAAMSPLGPNGDDVDRWFEWTSTGFRGITRAASPGFPTALATWDAAGKPLASAYRGVVGIAPDGHGGTLAIVPDPASLPDAISPPLFLDWIDAAGALTRSVALDNDVGAVVSNWTTGHVFALVFGSSARATQGRWYDANGNPLTAWFPLGVSKGSGTRWHFLVDGTLVLSGPLGEWVVAVRDGVEGPVPVPGWLRDRPNTRLSTIRDGRGYAVVTTNVATADRFEIVSTSGASCGVVVLPGVAPSSGLSTPRIDVGQDGSVIHSTGPTGDPAGSCTFRWWAGMLR